MTGRIVLAFSSVLVFCVVRADAQESRWVETNVFYGVGSACSAPFWVNGSQARIRYIPRGTGEFGIDLVDPETGDPVAILTRQARRSPLRGSKKLPQTGRFMLKVSGPGTRWEIRVEQYLSLIDEWHLVQLFKQQPPWLRLGTWTGEPGEHSYELSVPTQPWQVVCHNRNKTVLEVGITDGDGQVWFTANIPPQGEAAGYVPRGGSFTMGVRTEESDWQVDVLVQEE